MSSNSHKEYEVLRYTYYFNKQTRVLKTTSEWTHHKFYNTMESALDAAKDLRRNYYVKYDYPILHEPNNVGMFYVVLSRYKVVKRNMSIS